LRFFLYSSFVNSRRGRFSPGWYQLDAEPLRRVVETFSGLAGWAGPCPERPIDARISEGAFARNLALAYRSWADILKQQESYARTSSTLVPGSKSYETWRQEGGRSQRYSAVHQLRSRLLANARSDFFVRAIIHGSVATLDDTPGFSDLDLAFVVRRAVLVNQQKLLELRQVAAEMLICTYEFDPFMHHCPYYISEIDLLWYPEAMFPLVLFQHGVDLMDAPEALVCLTRPSDDVTDELLAMFERWFQTQSSNGNLVRDRYDLEWMLGNAMLLPALYLQRRTRQFRYKRETFALAQREFSHEEWEPIRKATEIRATLAPRRVPPRALVALGTRLCAPGLVQWWARRHPDSVRAASESIGKLGPDYSQQVLRLLASMRTKLDKTTAQTFAANCQETEVGSAPGSKPSVASHFGDFASGPFSDLPRPVLRERYDDAIDLLLRRWTSLQQKPLAIYQLGQVGAPGISDLDFIVVVPRGQQVNWTEFQPESFPKWVQEMFTHAPYLCDTAAWTCLPAWFPVFDLRFLWGERFATPTIPDSVKAGSALGAVVDYLLVKLPRDILWLAWSRPRRIASLLCVLHSFKYTLRLAEEAGIPVSAEAVSTTVEVDRLRGTWFDLAEAKRIEILASLCVRTCESIGALMAQIDHTINRHTTDGVEVRELGHSTAVNDGLFHFVQNWTLEGSIQRAAEQFSAAGNFACACPLSFAQILAVYADECPAFRDYFNSLKCPTELRWDAGGWNDGLRYHARAMISYANNARLNGIPPQQYLALGFQPPVTRHTSPL
jgi:hypothetical protein